MIRVVDALHCCAYRRSRRAAEQPELQDEEERDLLFGMSEAWTDSRGRREADVTKRAALATEAAWEKGAAHHAEV